MIKYNESQLLASAAVPSESVALAMAMTVDEARFANSERSAVNP